MQAPTKKKTFLPEFRHSCAWCGKNEKKLKSCGGCMCRYYCGKDCQKKHWTHGHKDECKRIREPWNFKDIDFGANEMQGLRERMEYMMRLSKMGEKRNPETGIRMNPPRTGSSQAEENGPEVIRSLRKRTSNYSPLLSPLLTLGDKNEDAINKIASELLKLNPSNLELMARELIDMILDKDLHESDNEKSFFASINAVRVLAQIADKVAGVIKENVKELLYYIHDSQEEYDFCFKEFPKILASQDESCIPLFQEFYFNRKEYVWGRMRICETLEKMAYSKPEQLRESAVALFTEFLSQPDLQWENPGLCGSTVAALMKLKAKESEPVVKRAYEMNAVDLDSCGGFGNWQIEMYGTLDKNDPIVRQSWRGTEERDLKGEMKGFEQFQQFLQPK